MYENIYNSAKTKDAKRGNFSLPTAQPEVGDFQSTTWSLACHKFEKRMNNIVLAVYMYYNFLGGL